ncbi:hypothetical protein L0P88_20990 [Muricauda sp. SCSIO 64092]|uniref:hypothetical protein n=1 Tax=Allomuricauda sp. SCSIO 64092 TaxID=2908842 RepID=UPI001FF33E3D|nr:hypothetical protein [Muricauda sp. SCSIO 64092]UOY06385.1 hypothetical protein L0P88_20990 [Muricauda sp. SCSIO 64092]
MKSLSLETMENLSASGSRGCLIAGAIAGGLFVAGFLFAPAFVGSATLVGGASLSGCL